MDKVSTIERVEEVVELAELDLAMIGGGIGDVVCH
jgi:hypothetical protein